MHPYPDLGRIEKLNGKNFQMTFLTKNCWPALNHSVGVPVENVPYFRLGSSRGA